MPDYGDNAAAEAEHRAGGGWSQAGDGRRDGGWGGANASAREAKAKAGVYGKGEAKVLGVHGADPGTPEERNIFEAVRDYRNYGNTFGQRLGNFLAGAFGLNEIDPLTDPGYNPATTDRANWGWDPAGTIGSVAGMAFGIPGTGFLADKISSWAGRPLEINLGPSVFGGAFGDAPGAAPAAGAAWSSPPERGSAGGNGGPEIDPLNPVQMMPTIPGAPGGVPQGPRGSSTMSIAPTKPQYGPPGAGPRGSSTISWPRDGLPEIAPTWPGRIPHKPPGMPELHSLAETNPELFAAVLPYLQTRPGFKTMSMIPQYRAGAFA